MQTMEAIANRQSCRAYTGEQLTENELQTVLQAANAAPVAFGYYDELKLTVIQNPELLAKIDAAGTAFFQNPNIKVRYNAPTLIVISFKILGKIPDFLATSENKQAPTPDQYCNAACIAENIAIAATGLGLGNVYLGGAPVALAANPQLCTELKIPDGFIPAAAIALGEAAMPLKERELTVTKIATDIFN